MIRSAICVKFLPTVDEARPKHCVRCEVGAYEGEQRRIYGHGVVERQQRGPPGPAEAARCVVLRIRRFLCTGCGAVMLAVPGSCAPSKHFSGGAIGLALALWSAGRTAAQVREEVSDWKVLGVAARGWRSLSRWAGEVKTGKLFAWLSLGEQTGSARVVAGRAAQALRGYAPVEWRESPAWIQSQIGASHVS